MLIGFVNNWQETNSLEHNRRVFQDGEQLETLLYPKRFFHSNQEDYQEKCFRSDRVDEAKTPLKPYSL